MSARCSILEASEHWFEENVLQVKRAVLAVFWQEDCAACKRLLSLLRRTAPFTPAFPTIALLNRNECSALAARLGIISVPALLFFHEGISSYQFVGEISRRELDELLARAALLAHAEAVSHPGQTGIVGAKSQG
jgi:thioredoxin 1